MITLLLCLIFGIIALVFKVLIGVFAFFIFGGAILLAIILALVNSKRKRAVFRRKSDYYQNIR